MASESKGPRTVVTDFGATPKAVPKPASGKQASRDKRTDDGERRRTRPPTTQSPTAQQARSTKNRTVTQKLPGAKIADAHFSPGYDQAQLAADSAARKQAPSTIITSDEVLRTKDARLFLIGSPDSEQSAAFRVLRHQVEAKDKPQVIAVTSPTDGAGKTTAATNLALALAECGRARVALVEANFRRPAIARMFKINPQACFGDQLEFFHSAPGSPWHVTSLAACHLHVLALAPGRAPSPLLDGPAFRYAIDGLRAADYDHIVIDCSSVLTGADVNLVQDATDGVLMVARARKTTAREVRQAIDRLTPSHLLGTVLLGQ